MRLSGEFSVGKREPRRVLVLDNKVLQRSLVLVRLRHDLKGLVSERHLTLLVLSNHSAAVEHAEPELGPRVLRAAVLVDGLDVIDGGDRARVQNALELPHRVAGLTRRDVLDVDGLVFASVDVLLGDGVPRFIVAGLGMFSVYAQRVAIFHA